MSYSLIQTVTSFDDGGTNPTNLSVVPTHLGSLLSLVIVCNHLETILSVSDDVSNTWVLRQTVNSVVGSHPKTCYYYDCFPSKSGASVITFSTGTPLSLATVGFREYSGVTSGFDASGTSSGSTDNPSVPSTSTSSYSSGLVLLWVGSEELTGPSVGTGYGNFSELLGPTHATYFEDRAYSSTGSFSGSIVGLTSSSAWSAGIATYSTVTVPVSITLSATGGVGKSGISLGWTSLSNVSYYTVYRYSINYGGYIPLAVTTNLAYFDTAVGYGITYYYYVVATLVGGGVSSASNVAYATITLGGIFMAGQSRSTLYQVVQVGQETTAGVLVPATRRLPGWEMIPVPDIMVKPHKSDGAKGAADIQLGFRYVTSKITAPWNYTSTLLLVSMAYGLPTTSTILGATTWTSNPSATDPDIPQSYTFEIGSAKGAEKFGYGVCQDFSFKWTDADASLDATIMGNGYTRDAVMTVDYAMTVSGTAAMGATSLPVTTTQTSGTIPNGTYVTGAGKVFTVTGGGTITAGAATLTVSALAAGITSGDNAFSVPEMKVRSVDPVKIQPFISLDGTTWTALHDVIDGSLNFQGLWEPSRHNDETQNSYDRVKQKGPNITATITAEEGSETDNWMGYLDNKQKVYLGVKAQGPTAGTGSANYLFRMNMPVYVIKPDPGNKSDILGNTLSLECAHDLAFGLFNLQVVNEISTLA